MTSLRYASPDHAERPRRTASLVLVAAAALLPLQILAACDPPPTAGASAPAPLSSSMRATPPQSPPPGPINTRPAPPPPPPPAITAPGPFIELAVEGHAAAVVSLPLGATSPRPVVIAAHGNYDRPEWQCDVWRGVAGGGVFILCPRGVPRPDSPGPDDTRYTYSNNEALEREIRAGLDALRARFPQHVDKGPILYTGFSLGAIMGVSIVARDPALFPRAVLVEGGHDKWTPATVAAYTKGGSPRVLFACGQAGCEAAAKPRAALLEKAGAAAKIVHGKGVGHSYDGAVAREVKAALPWVTEGDPRFAP